MTSNTIPRNTVCNDDCIKLMQNFDTASSDFILTDPPYITNYKGRDGRYVPNDDNARWLKPAFQQMYRVLSPAGSVLAFTAGIKWTYL